LFLGIDQGRAVYLGIILAMVSFIAAVLGRMGAGGKRSSESRLYAELQVLAGRLGAQEQKINELERRTVESPAMVWRAAANDIDVLGSLVRDLAKTVAGHDERLNQILPAPSGTVAEIFREPGTPSSEGDAETVGAPNMEPTAMVNGAGTANEDAVDYARIVRNALSSDRLELCLQPLVTLPQRRTVAYEATLQLRAEGEATALRGELRRLAQAASLTFDLDMTLVRRAVQVMRVLRARERDVDIVCAVAASTLADERFGDELDAAAEGDATLKAKLLLDIAAADWDAAPAGALRAATAKGCHLAPDIVRREAGPRRRCTHRPRHGRRDACCRHPPRRCREPAATGADHIGRGWGAGRDNRCRPSRHGCAGGAGRPVRSPESRSLRSPHSARRSVRCAGVIRS
jgi:cyclic-di-GMP phosphodiesterase TipF (flagellum assembly factor)